MVLYFGCLAKDLDPKIVNVLSVVILVIILSLPLLLNLLSGHRHSDKIYTLIMISAMFLAILQILALFCKKYRKL
jgi:fumarate reductase subunit D